VLLFSASASGSSFLITLADKAFARSRTDSFSLQQSRPSTTHPTRDSRLVNSAARAY
jgi:hypothetical protein